MKRVASRAVITRNHSRGERDLVSVTAMRVAEIIGFRYKASVSRAVKCPLGT